MRRMLFLAAMALAATSAPLSAQAGDRVAVAAVPQQDALALARLMSPSDLLVDMEIREFDKHFVASLRSDPDLKSLEDEYPGLFEAMHKSTRDLVAKGMVRTIDQVHAAIGALIQEQFTAADITELTNFYRSPIGQKTLQQMAGAADASEIYRQAVERDDFKLSEDYIASRNMATASKAAKSFTPDEQAQMLLFMAKPSFGKLAKAQPQIQKILAEKFNAPDPEFDREVEEAMASAIERHISSFEEKSDGK